MLSNIQDVLFLCKMFISTIALIVGICLFLRGHLTMPHLCSCAMCKGFPHPKRLPKNVDILNLKLWSCSSKSDSMIIKIPGSDATSRMTSGTP